MDVSTQAYLDGIKAHEKAMDAYLSGKLAHPNILRNYRSLYKSNYGTDFSGSDLDLTGIIQEIGVLSTSEEQDLVTLEEMANFPKSE